MKVRKSNIEIVKNYLAGEKVFVTVGYQPPVAERKEGERWVDASGVTWEQKDGWKTRVNEQAEMIRNASKRVCGCGQEIRFGSKLDNDFFIKTGKCYECLIKEETELRILGVFPYYETWKVASNYLGFLKDMKGKIEDSIHYFEGEDGTLRVLCNGEGFIEQFKGLNTAELLDGAKEDLKKITDLIEKVISEKDEAKRIYDEKLADARTRLALIK